jgi:hypothetical protein
MNEVENKDELKVRQLLEAELNPGEELLAYTQSQTAGLITRKIHNLGLTTERLMIMRVRKDQPSGRVLNIRRNNVEKLSWSGVWATLKIKLGSDTLSFNCRKGYWKKRAKAMANTHSQMGIPDASTNMILTSQERLQQAQDFQELGLLNSGKAELEKAIQANPGLATDSEVVSLRKKLVEQSLALRVGAGFFAITLLLLIVFALLGSVWLNPIGVILLIFTGYNLWRGNTSWRWWGIFLGIINALIFSLGSWAAGGILEALSWAAFGAAVLIVLTGVSQRSRTWIAVGVYTFGHLGLLVLAFVIALITAVTETL